MARAPLVRRSAHRGAGKSHDRPGLFVVRPQPGAGPGGGAGAAVPRVPPAGPGGALPRVRRAQGGLVGQPGV